MLYQYIALLRPAHYIKNLYIFLPIFFSGQLLNRHDLTLTTIAFAAFCLAASAIYILNDIIDVDLDRQHVVKRNRPIAAGMVKPSVAYFLTFILMAASAWVASLVSLSIVLIIGAYCIVNIFYSLKLKNIAIVDVSIISIGFVLRTFAGGMATNIVLSKWLVIMVFLLSMFQALAKRMDDLHLAGDSPATLLRKSLNGYNIPFLQIVLSMLSGILIVCYIMYIVQPEIVHRLGEHSYGTAFFVLMGLLRYLQLTFVRKTSGSPVKILFKDRFIQLCVVCWILSFTILIYMH